ncbi:MAG: hypothetical protein COW42_05495 [Deltaproteobacteria bacterium CG17_big_fil_post_rev_8_21_14_2_50_63_7]|nr:MAG: hypothetical protein COW42_05495 [Deltaproteobacteria bacterium CG17_big_fil_post_rev_8_21_14_2_50_63_7]
MSLQELEDLSWLTAQRPLDGVEQVLSAFEGLPGEPVSELPVGERRTGRQTSGPRHEGRGLDEVEKGFEHLNLLACRRPLGRDRPL